MKNEFTTTGVLATAVLLLFTRPVQAQVPEAFTNLQVLPKETPKRELEATMRRFAFALGVRCDHCHAARADKSMDFAADEKDAKKTARLMLQMVAVINRDYIGRVGTVPPTRVECVTCHRGLTEPRTLLSLLDESAQKAGIEDAVALYRDLRGKYYGSGQYDFGETTLNQLAEALLARKQVREAVAVMEMNFASNHPDSLWAYHMLAQAHEENREVAKAIADYRKVLALHPDDTWARDQLAILVARQK